MQWRAFEIRIGQAISDAIRIDVVHDNEGHPLNHHRDGFATQATLVLRPSDNLRVEGSVGPYGSFDTTTDRNGIQHDDKRIGILAGAAILYYLNWIEPGLHLRVGYNHVEVLGAQRSDAVLFGVGMDFGESGQELVLKRPSEDPIQLLVSFGGFKTNRDGTDTAYGGRIELRKYLGERIAFSLSWLEEGRDQLVDRHGAAGQLWAVFPISETWSVSAGAGPYLARNAKGSDRWGLNGIISLELQHELGPENSGWSVFVRFNRIVSNDDTDRDMGEVGVGKKW
jgi:hypothetical protein